MSDHDYQITLLRTIASALRAEAATINFHADSMERVANELDAPQPDPTPDPDPTPVPDPDPIPEPPTKSTQIGWNLSPQNYYEPVQYWTDWMANQIYDVDPRASLDETGMVFAGPNDKIEVFRIHGTMRDGSYMDGQGRHLFTVIDKTLNAKSVHRNGPIAIYRENDWMKPDGPTQSFLERHKHSSHIRFMDTCLTNSREPLGHEKGFWRYLKTPRGTHRIFRMMTPEIAVQLARQSNSDIWWNFHHLDSGERIRFICNRFKELDFEGKIIFEHSNEVWYGLFPANRWLLNQVDGDQRRAFNLHGMFTSGINTIVKNVLGDQAIVVAGSQTANYGVTEYTIEGIKDSGSADAIAVAAYFGDLEQYDEPMTQRGILDWIRRYEIERTRKHLLKQKEIIEAAGMEMMIYEGGIHLRPSEEYREILDAVVRSDEAAEIMDNHLTWFENNIGGRYTVYSDVGKKTWGHWEEEWAQPQPRGKVVLEHMEKP